MYYDPWIEEIRSIPNSKWKEAVAWRNGSRLLIQFKDKYTWCWPQSGLAPDLSSPWQRALEAYYNRVRLGVDQSPPDRYLTKAPETFDVTTLIKVAICFFVVVAMGMIIAPIFALISG